MICPRNPEEGIRSLEAGLQVVVGPSLNSDLLPEQPELLTTEPSAPALKFYFLFSVVRNGNRTLVGVTLVLRISFLVA